MRILSSSFALGIMLLGACRAGAPNATESSDAGLRNAATGTAVSLRTNTPEPAILGAAPLCEASAALIAPWDDTMVLVVDNEVDDALFAFSVEGGRLAGQRSLALAKGAPKDLEALAAVDGRVLAVGSFSRNKRCEVKRNRARLLLLERDPSDGRSEDLRVTRAIDGRDVLSSLRDEKTCVTGLFTQPAPEGARKVCAALVAAESAAERGEGCDTLNIEGAAGLPGETDRVWLGLRSPLVDGRAVLLRLVESLDVVRFDAVALVDLEGRSVRGLERRGDRVWGIAGPVADSKDAFRLFSIPVDGLVPGARLEAQLEFGQLPSSSEGLVFVGDRLHVVIDGGAGKGACKQPARQLSMPAAQR